MGGEHFSSSTGKDLDKQADAYVRFKWETKCGEKRPRQTILEKEKILENKDLTSWITGGYLKNPGTCVCCNKSFSWPLLHFEIYNWKAKNKEEDYFAHEECLKTNWPKLWQLLEGLRLMGKNPNFLIELNCLSTSKCAFFTKSSDFRNCSHIVLRFDSIHENNGDGTVSVNMTPLLYCKRAHPGEHSLETEEDTWWNVEDAGLVRMTDRIAKSINTPQTKAVIDNYKKSCPQVLFEIKKMLTRNPNMLSLLAPQVAVLADLILNEPLYPLALKETAEYPLAVKP